MRRGWVFCAVCVFYVVLYASSSWGRSAGSASVYLLKYTKAEDGQSRGERPLETPGLNPLAAAEGHGQVQAAGS